MKQNISPSCVCPPPNHAMELASTECPQFTSAKQMSCSHASPYFFIINGSSFPLRVPRLPSSFFLHLLNPLTLLSHPRSPSFLFRTWDYLLHCRFCFLSFLNPPLKARRFFQVLCGIRLKGEKKCMPYHINFPGGGRGWRYPWCS